MGFGAKEASVLACAESGSDPDVLAHHEQRTIHTHAAPAFKSTLALYGLLDEISKVFTGLSFRYTGPS